MAEVKWIKIVTDVFDDEKILMIESLPEADSIIVIWFKLLCLAGKQNNSGVFQMGRMPYTDEMFATIFRRPINTIRLALNAFEQYGMIEIINNTVTIPNWDKHQSLDSYEKKKERDRIYQRERRAMQRALTEKSSDTSSDVAFSDKNRQEETRLEGEEDINTLSDEFETLWSMFPRKEGKKAAFASYQRASKKGVTFETVQNGITNYLNYIRVKKIEPQYIKQGSTWFNGECWNDEYDYSPSESAQTKSNCTNPFLEMMMKEEQEYGF